MATAEVGSVGHTQARQAFDQALATMDTVRREQAALYSLHPAAKKVLATLDREWDGLARHRDFPDIALDNNPAERALRTPVVGRKNYYGSHASWAADLAGAPPRFRTSDLIRSVPERRGINARTAQKVHA